MYPNGYDDENSNYLGIFVKHKEGNNKYLLKSTISILDSNGKDKKVPCELPGKILSCKQMHGTKKYILRDTLLQNSQIYFNDSVTFLLEAEVCLPDSKLSITEYAEEDVETTLNTENELLERDISSRIQADYSALLKSGAHTDMVIKCGTESITRRCWRRGPRCSPPYSSTTGLRATTS